MINSVKITEDIWKQLKDRIIEEHGANVLLLRPRCRERLGFVVRHHQEWVKTFSNRWAMKEMVYLDFFNEPQQTMFFLKYSDIINAE